jgi:hypothetical protein
MILNVWYHGRFFESTASVVFTYMCTDGIRFIVVTESTALTELDLLL